tara:strand:+ start:2054 stop:2479 length:426 start_codon:yes stop_codon:yes gene_type:complete
MVISNGDNIMIFTVWQIQYSDADIAAINADQPNAKHKARTEMNFDFNCRYSCIAEQALTDGLYTHVSDIRAETPDQCFEIGNIGPESAITRFSRMSSLSVGDIIVDVEGNVMVVANYGFVAIGFKPEMSAANLVYNMEEVA